MSSHVEAIGTCNLVLSTGFILELEKTFLCFKFLKEFNFNFKTCTFRIFL